MDKPEVLPSNSEEDLYQVSLLIEQLKHDDTHIRVNATKNIERIGIALFKTHQFAF